MNDLQIEWLIRDHRARIDRELTEIRLGREASNGPAREPGLPRHARLQFADWLLRVGRRLVRQEDPVDGRPAAIRDLDCVCRPGMSGGQA